jgi:peptidoglycan/LPS O-acetylase OafA/YrhL
MKPECAADFNELRYSPQLDGVRGISILGVLLVHTNHTFGWSILSGGNLGVDLFFVLSGFLITSILLRELNTSGRIDFKKFYARRALRLVPALLVMLAITMTAAPFFYSPQEKTDTWLAGLLSFLYVTDFAIAFFETPLGAFRHTWSLSIEEQFYLAWPITLLGLSCFLVKRKRIAWTVGMLAIGFASWSAFVWWYSESIARTYYSVDTRAVSLLIGSIAGMIFSWRLLDEYPHSKPVLHALSFLSLGIIGIGFVSTDYSTPILYQYGFFVFGVAAAILILSVVTFENSIITNAVRVKVFVWLGSISYGIYLWHYPIFKAVHDFTGDWYEKLLVVLGLTLATAYLSYHFIERPFLQLKERFR